MKWENEKKNLDYYINTEHISYEALGRKYGCSGAAVKKAAKRLGINIPTRRTINEKETFRRGTAKKGKCKYCGKEFVLYQSSRGIYCSLECSQKDRHLMNYQKLVEGDESIMRANYSPRPFKEDIIREQGGVCAICGCEQMHNNKPLVFIIDHIDGNAANNIRDNLRCICPNCDSQLDTYKSKNKSSARYYYRYGNKR